MYKYMNVNMSHPRCIVCYCISLVFICIYYVLCTIIFNISACIATIGCVCVYIRLCAWPKQPRIDISASALLFGVLTPHINRKE